MTTGDVTDGVSHGEHRQSEGKGDAHKSDPPALERRPPDCATATPENQPERTDEFSCEALAYLHGDSFLFWRVYSFAAVL